MRTNDSAPTIMVWGGETVVTIVGDSGAGGRSQELALAAAELLRGGHDALLAAGTDGRDGPTDAAGALVSGTTWVRVAEREPQPGRRPPASRQLRRAERSRGPHQDGPHRDERV